MGPNHGGKRPGAGRKRLNPQDRADYKPFEPTEKNVARALEITRTKAKLDDLILDGKPLPMDIIMGSARHFYSRALELTAKALEKELQGFDTEAMSLMDAAEKQYKLAAQLSVPAAAFFYPKLANIEHQLPPAKPDGDQGVNLALLAMLDALADGARGRTAITIDNPKAKSAPDPGTLRLEDVAANLRRRIAENTAALNRQPN